MFVNSEIMRFENAETRRDAKCFAEFERPGVPPKEEETKKEGKASEYLKEQIFDGKHRQKWKKRKTQTRIIEDILPSQ